MAFSKYDYVLRKVRRVTQVSLEDNTVDWTIRDIQNPQIEFTGESTEVTDGDGVLLKKFDTAKGVSFSGEGTVFSMSMLAAQRGSRVEVASEDAPVTGEIFEVLTISDGTITLTYTPSETPDQIYVMTEEQNIGEPLTVGTEEGDATIDGNVITLPDTITSGNIGVLYTFETTSAVKFTDITDEFADEAKYIVQIYAEDMCSSTERLGLLVFPKAKIDNNFSITLTSEGTHPFSFEALKDYCSDEAILCYLLWCE